MYAWFDECQLAEGLAVALGRHAAAAAGPYAKRVRAASAPAERDLDDNDLLLHTRGPHARRRRDDAVMGRTPNRLDALVRRTLARSPAAIAIDTIPWTMQGDVGFDVWQGVCGAPAARRNPTVERFAPLVAVAREWGIEADEAEWMRPELLCGRLAHDAIRHGIRHGARLAPDASARSGRPTTASAEGTAIEAVCYDDRPDRPFERADASAVDAAIAKAFQVAHRRPPRPEDAGLIDAVTDLVTEANRIYGVPSASGTRLHTVDTQATLAMLALRSGARLEPADLSDAGRACAALTPTYALAP
ncbi:hypothetical protein pneo_cds_1034 [Pandoravirus neocaledonia]|uniref:Uncharacterized protein n=1 Tax=Pandoravirus neocaledonia TaxID=2107708 RepID=A0A2U7UDV5_9VIRU|nr:hypothetical protein pneo_cds_1034 [Pandoravirus neocaledonia]AVK76641.1 hypothetical protein pneo_cds_1034 [Pandoravirus neocaledonia]